MRSICLALILLVASVAHAEYPTVNLPLPLRQKNWGGGSCVHATLVSLLRWSGRYNMADYWRRTYGEGEYESRFAQRLEANGIRFAQTVGKFDVGFLQWACDTRRGAGVTCLGGAHCIALVHLDATWAGVLDNNQVTKIRWIPREKFLKEWRDSGSWGFAVIYTPAAPLPSR